MKSRTLIALALLSLLVPFTSCKKSTAEGTSANTPQPAESNDSTAQNVIPVPTPEEVKTYYGIDVSHWNGDEVKEIDPSDSITFIICKATQGTTSVDPDFNDNWTLIGEKGAIRGAYHFYLVGEDPVKQAKHFYSIVSSKGTTDMALIVDIEQASLPAGKPADPAKIQADLLSFLGALYDMDLRTPIIYTGYAFANEYLTQPIFAEYPLWLADYAKASKPPVPMAWKETGWKFWQKSDDYGIHSHPTDFDIFVGKKSDLTR